MKLLAIKKFKPRHPLSYPQSINTVTSIPSLYHHNTSQAPGNQFSSKTIFISSLASYYSRPSPWCLDTLPSHHRFYSSIKLGGNSLLSCLENEVTAIIPRSPTHPPIHPPTHTHKIKNINIVHSVDVTQFFGSCPSKFDGTVLSSHLGF